MYALHACPKCGMGMGYFYLSHDWQNSRLLIGQLPYDIEVVLTSQNPVHINLPVCVCMYACSFLLPMQRLMRQS